jgi:hypothetical protein
VSYNNDRGAARPSGGGKRGSLSQKEFARWEEEHLAKESRKGDEEKKTIQKVKQCISLAVKGGVCLLIGIAGISSWPFFCTTTASDELRMMFVVPFSVITLVGLIVVITAGIRFLSSKGSDSKDT